MYALIIISCLAILVLYLGLGKVCRPAILPVSILGMLGALGAIGWSWNQNPKSYYNDMLSDSHFSLAFSALMIACALLIMLFSKDYFKQFSQHEAEYYALMLFSVCGGIIMASFSNLTMLFLGLEIVSVCVYILAGINRRDPLSNEASLKYFLMGAFFTAFLLLGIAFVYGATATFNIEKIGMAIQSGNYQPYFLHTGIILILIALAFKVSAAPFHFWTPDVYEGSPSLVTAFMSTVVKIAGFAAILTLFEHAFGSLNGFWASSIWVIAALTLCVGNIAALVQKSVKRMLAYSGISHAGYLMIAILVAGSLRRYDYSLSDNGILIYSIAYSLATITAFAGLIIVHERTGSNSIEAFQGLGKKNPLLAFAITISMCSLAGIPLTAGFFGKYYIFSDAINRAQYWIVIVGIINAVIGIYYYFKVIIAMYFVASSDEQQKITVNFSVNILLLACTMLTIVLGIYPSFFANFLN